VAPAPADERKPTQGETTTPAAGDPPAVGETNPPAGETTPPADPRDLEAARLKRLRLEAVHGTLGRKRCERCATLGAWERYSQEGDVLYIRCRGCGHLDKAPVIVEEKTHGKA